MKINAVLIPLADISFKAEIITAAVLGMAAAKIIKDSNLIPPPAMDKLVDNELSGYILNKLLNLFIQTSPFYKNPHKKSFQVAYGD